MNLVHFEKPLFKWFFSLFLFIFFSTLLILFFNNLVIKQTFAVGDPGTTRHGNEGDGCHCDYDSCGTIMSRVYNDDCAPNVPYCIEGSCHANPAPFGGKCGEDEDCNPVWGSGNHVATCTNKVCQPIADCSSQQFDSQGACNTTGTKCFWYTGGKGDSRGKCIKNDGNNYGESCGQGDKQGNCIAGTNSCFPISTKEYCSNHDEGPISSSNPAPQAPPPASYSSSTTVSGTVNIGGLTTPVANYMTIHIHTKDSAGNNNEFNSSFSTSGSRSPGYSITDNYTPANGTSTELSYVVYLFDNQGGNQIGEGTGNNVGSVTYGSASNTLNMSVNVTGAGTVPPHNDTSGSGTCETDDNKPLNASLVDKTFHCKSACTPGTEEDKTGQGPLYACSNSLKCCKDIAKYKANYGSPLGGDTGPGTSTTPPPASSTTTTPPPSGTGICADKGGPDTTFSKPDGFWGSMCDGNFINQTDPKTAKIGRQYADRYKCVNTGTDGKNYEDRNSYTPTGTDNPCNNFPWLDSTPPGPTCIDANKNPVDCQKVFAPNYSCTYDYNSSGTNTTTRCCPDGKRYCPTAGTCVSAAQGCGGLQSGIGQTCGTDSQCADYAAGARCLPLGTTGGNTCQWPGGVAPAPTAGASTNCTVGFKGTGCPCGTNPSSCGCASTHNPELSTDDPTNYYCVPFASGLRWCVKSQTAIPPTSCTAAPAYTPPPTAVPTQSPGCPNDGNHLCVPLASCQPGYGPTNDSFANTACANWNHDTPLCYMKGAAPLSTCTTTAPPSTSGTPAATGCPVDNGDGRVNSCQQSCGGSYPNARPVGDADCAAAYGTIRGACCTSN